MNLDFTSEDMRFRDEVRAFLDRNLSPELRRAGRLATSVYTDSETMRTWHAILYRKGWVAPSWPVEYGGCGWSVTKRYIFASELADADAPALSPMGLSMCGPMLIGCGTSEQKAYYLPRILSGEDFWCQGYSEPAAGSDLAALQMKATDAGDHWICNGRKIWTTHAMLANKIFCLVRTATDGPPQRGITFLLIDMHAPGVTVRPITMLTGEQIQCEISFDDVAVSKSNAVGNPGEGWTVAKYLLQFERGGSFTAPGLRAKLRRAKTLFRTLDLGSEESLALKIAEAEIALTSLEYSEFRVALGSSQTAPAGAAASMIKIRSSELSQRITELALEIGGPLCVPYQSGATCPGGPIAPNWAQYQGQIGPEDVAPIALRYLNERAGSIYAGSNEIQRNILAKIALGL